MAVSERGLPLALEFAGVAVGQVAERAPGGGSLDGLWGCGPPRTSTLEAAQALCVRGP